MKVKGDVPNKRGSVFKVKRRGRKVKITSKKFKAVFNLDNESKHLPFVPFVELAKFDVVEINYVPKAPG